MDGGDEAAAVAEAAGAPAGGRGALRRWRRENVPGGRVHCHKVRVSPAEEGQLARLAAAQRVTVPRLLVEAALAPPGGQTATERREAIAELFRAVRLLAGIANNVNQIAKAANAAGQAPPETAAVLDAVRRVAARIEDAIGALWAGR